MRNNIVLKRYDQKSDLTQSNSFSVSYGTISATTSQSATISKEVRYESGSKQIKTTPSANIDKTTTSRQQYFNGIILMLLSAIALSGQGVCIKFGKELGYHPFELLLTRGIIQAILTSFVVVYNKIYENSHTQIDDDKNDNNHDMIKLFTSSTWFYIILRGILAFGTAYFSYCGWSLLPLGDAVSLFSTFPIWTVIVCAIFLREKIRIYHIISIISGICGVILITQPTFIFHGNAAKNNNNTINYLGVFFCLFAAVINGFAFLCLRKLKDIPAIYSVFSYSFGVIIGTLIIGLLFDYNDWKGIDFNKYYDFTLLISIGIFGFLGQFLKTKSCQFIEGGIGSIVRSTDVIFAYLWQITFFHIIPTWITFCGAFCVILPVIIISIMKIKDSRDRKRQIDKSRLIMKA